MVSYKDTTFKFRWTPEPVLWKQGHGGAKAEVEIKSLLMCLFTRLLCGVKRFLCSLECRPPTPLHPPSGQKSITAALNVHVKGCIKGRPLSSGNGAQKVT